MEWQVILAVALAIPFMLVPAALAWYLSASGVLQVIRDARQRQKRRIAREKEAKTAAEIVK